METQLLIEKPIKLKYTTADITVKNCTFNENNRPVKLITSKDLEYSFPKMISTNNFILIQLRKFLTASNKITIIHDNKYRIHKINNIALCWTEIINYKLMILSFTKGLLFNDYVEITAFENVTKFYKIIGYEKFFHQGIEITIIIKDTLPVDIPTKY